MTLLLFYVSKPIKLESVYIWLNIYVQNSMSFCPIDPDNANNSTIDLHPKHTVFHNKACNIPQVS